jgi:hypothetical protein
VFEKWFLGEINWRVGWVVFSRPKIVCSAQSISHRKILYGVYKQNISYSVENMAHVVTECFNPFVTE